MKSFEGRVAVVTGAASGIGRSLALALAAEGARLALSDVDTEGLAQTAALAAPVGLRLAERFMSSAWTSPTAKPSSRTPRPSSACTAGSTWSSTTPASR